MNENLGEVVPPIPISTEIVRGDADFYVRHPNQIPVVLNNLCDEIEALRAEVQRLREALTGIDDELTVERERRFAAERSVVESRGERMRAEDAIWAEQERRERNSAWDDAGESHGG